MRRRFHTLDVFTDEPLSGNPLAVILDAEGLDTARMQAIAREFNLSETVFVLEPRDPVNSARIRIFTPGRELPFAGHPTIGTAVLLAETRGPEIVASKRRSASFIASPAGSGVGRARPSRCRASHPMPAQRAPSIPWRPRFRSTPRRSASTGTVPS